MEGRVSIRVNVRDEPAMRGGRMSYDGGRAVHPKQWSPPRTSARSTAQRVIWSS